MPTILCYGDSNTWGYVPIKATRYGRQERWPGVLQAELGADYHIIEEGLNSRTTVLEDPTRGPGRNGLPYLGPCLDSHAPLDLVILMLGTNDLKHRFGLSAADIAVNISALITMIQRCQAGANNTAPPLLLISPPHVGPLSASAFVFEGAEEKSRQLAHHYQLLATQMGCHFFDAATVVEASQSDGVHWEASEHAKLGRRVAAVVRSILQR